MDLLHIIILAVLQGLTEFLPVSSSGHLILPTVLLGWQDQGLAFDVAIHMGTLTAVMVYFRKDMALLIRDWTGSLTGKGKTPHSRMAWFVGFATIPALAFGLIIKKTGVDDDLRTLAVITATTLIFGALLGVADHVSKRTVVLEKMTFRQAMVIGFSQALSLIPGTSRSGITMTAALMLGFTREAAARFSFLLSIPVILGAGALLTIDLFSSPVPVDWHAMITGTFISAISALLCIHLFLGIINRMGLMPFVIYRLALGLVLLLFMI